MAYRSLFYIFFFDENQLFICSCIFWEKNKRRKIFWARYFNFAENFIEKGPEIRIFFLFHIIKKHLKIG